jgi:tRNA threonylcarbamoyladenosine biosynthesis protein TsaB
LLALDTATERCSAALWFDGPCGAREALPGRGHAELILPMIDELLAEAGAGLKSLDAIAFGRGPGAFTGVRLAVSLAQGLGWSVGLPLIPVSDLRAVAARVLTTAAMASQALVCFDARMQEVYWGCFEQHGQHVRAVGDEAVGPPVAVRLPAHWQVSGVRAAGSGFAAYATDLAQRFPGLHSVDPQALPHALDIARLAAADGMRAAIPAEAAHPVYLRDDVARVPAATTATRPSPN